MSLSEELTFKKTCEEIIINIKISQNEVIE